MKILAITQARVGSTRLPGKILKSIKDETLLEIHIKRILKSKKITKLKVATTIEPGSEKIVALAKKLGVESYRGSIDNVLERFYETALPENPDWIVRLTSDCPLIDSDVIDKVLEFTINNNLDYASNGMHPTFPDGLDTEVFKFSALEKAYKDAVLKSDLEHVTPYIKKNSTYRGGNLFKSDCFLNDTDYSSFRITIDTIEDFQVIEFLINKLGYNQPWIEYIKTLQDYEEIRKLNQKYERNEGLKKSIKNDQ